jgi:hypothetical protein
METRSMTQMARTMAPTTALLTIILAQVAIASPSPVINRYFPLHENNRWIYVQAPAVNGFDHQTLSLRKTEEVQISRVSNIPDEGRVFELTNYTFGLGADPVSFLGGGSMNGPVVEWMGGQAGTWYRFEVGNQIEIPAFGNDCVRGSKGAVVRLVDRETLAGRFANCVEIVYSTNPCMDLGLASEVFAPGIGLIERTLRTKGGSELQTWQLKFAQVNGVTIPARTQSGGGIADHQAAAAPLQTAPSTWGQIKATLATR